MGRFSVLVRSTEDSVAQVSLSTDSGQTATIAPLATKGALKSATSAMPRVFAFFNGDVGTELQIEVQDARKQVLATTKRVVLSSSLPRGHDFRIDLGLGVSLEVCCFDFGSLPQDLKRDEDDLESSMFSQFVVDVELMELRDLDFKDLASFVVSVSHMGSPTYVSAPTLSAASPTGQITIREDCSFFLNAEDPLMTIEVHSSNRSKKEFCLRKRINLVIIY